MGQLCAKAPEAAHTIAGTIQKSAVPPRKRKRKPNKDPSYHPAKSAKCRACSTPANNSGNEHDFDKALRAPSKTHGEPSIELTPLPSYHPSQEDSSKIRIITSTPGKSEKPPLYVSAESTPRKEPWAPISAELVPASLTDQGYDGSSTPHTEEIRRDKTPASFEGITSTGQSTSGPLFTEASSIIDLILDAARTIHQLSRHQDGVPQDLHMRVLQSFQGNHPEAIAASACSQWSDGSMWMQVLEMGTSQQSRVTVLNMLEYMGAWKWYNSQVTFAQATIQTKKRKQVEHRGAATHVLNKIQEDQMRSPGRGRWISGVGIVTLEGDEPKVTSKNGTVNITESERRSRRKYITMQLSRGQKLSTKLVGKLGFGILFNRKIW
jgi:hypothetical protein